MQRLNAYLVEEITKILETEIKHNSEVIKVFLDIPWEDEEQLIQHIKQPKQFIKKA